MLSSADQFPAQIRRVLSAFIRLILNGNDWSASAKAITQHFVFSAVLSCNMSGARSALAQSGPLF